MAKKQQDIKKYLDSIGKTENLHIFIANSDNYLSDGSNDSSLELWNNSIFSKRIARNDVVGAIPNITWQSGTVYNVWSALSTSNENFYVWNKENGNVYICLSNNEYNRKDLYGTKTSTYVPNHAYGIQAYPDGYTWLPIYRITGDYLRFVKNNWIPVISFEDFNLSSFSTDEETINNFCNSSVDTNGFCSLYFKENKKLATTGGTLDSYTQGERFKIFESTCSECYYMFNGNDTFKPLFYGATSDSPTSVTIQDKFDEIGSLISDGRIPASSAFYALYDIANNGPDDGAIVSVNIDLSPFTQSQLQTTIANPEFTITSYSGTGASIRLKTYNTATGVNIISGIEILSNGSGYKDILLDISSSVFVSNIKTQLLNSIEINLDIIDGLNVDPYDVLECKNIMIDSRIETSELSLAKVDLPDTFNMYGLVSNPLELTTSGDYVVSGSELPPNRSKITASTVEFAVIYEGDISGPSVSRVPARGSLKLSPTNNLATITTPNAKNVYSTSSTKYYLMAANESFMSVTGTNLNYIKNSQYFSDKDNYNFIKSRIIKEPDLKQYSGKVLQTKKSTAPIKLTDTQGEMTKIIRINIIRGI